MKEKLAWTGWIILFVVLIFLVAQYFLFNNKLGKNEVWEYTTLVRLNQYESSKQSENELNALGKEGWELVAQESSDGPGTHVLIFKRKKQ